MNPTEYLFSLVVVGLMCVATVVLIISYVVAEVRAHIWASKPDPDPWVKRRVE